MNSLIRCRASYACVPPFRSRLGRPGGPAARPCDVTIPAPDRFPSSARNLPTQVIVPIPDTTIRDDRERPTPRPRPVRPARNPVPLLMAAAGRHWKTGPRYTPTPDITVPACRTARNAMKPGSSASEAQCEPGSRRPAADRPRCGAELPGHFRLSGRSWERRRPVSEAGYRTLPSNHHPEHRFAGAGGAAAGAPSCIRPPSHSRLIRSPRLATTERRGPSGGLPLAAGSAAGSARRPAPPAQPPAHAHRACAAAARRALSRTRSRAQPPAHARAHSRAQARAPEPGRRYSQPAWSRRTRPAGRTP